MSNYIKQNFYDGQTLEAKHLNNIEDGIVANAQALNKVDEVMEEINAVLESALSGGGGSGGIPEEVVQQQIDEIAELVGVDGE